MRKTISEMISQMATKPSHQLEVDLEKSFLDRHFGLSMDGLPEGMPGERYIAGDNELKMKIVSAPNGESMIKACAEPELFVKNFHETITVTMTGREIIEMILKMPEIDGILICSATSFHSYPIYKQRCVQLINIQTKIGVRPWWKIW
jgi:hypothetical protein